MPAGIINVNIALKSTYQTFKVMFSHSLLNCNLSRLISIPDKLSDKMDGFPQYWMLVWAFHRCFPFLSDGLHSYEAGIVQIQLIFLKICTPIF